MCRLFFIGSTPEHKSGTSKSEPDKYKDLFNAARLLGGQAVERGHKILIVSDSPNTIDKYIMDGIVEHCNKHNKSASVELHRPEGSCAIYTKVHQNIQISRIDYDSDTEAKTKWIVSHVRALDSCDVVILIGGGNSTKLIGNIAADRQIPVLAVPNFGGSAEVIYEKLKYHYKNIMSGDSDLSVLSQEWSNSSAQKIIGLAETMRSQKRGLKEHSYFISYNWVDVAYADNVELNFLRNKRIVNRDERSLTPGSDLSEGVKLLIEESDTFIGLYSENFKNSSWCPNELAYAQRRSENGKKPKRVVLISLDDSEVPIKYEGKLRMAGGSRAERELSVLTIIRSEFD